MKTDLRIGSEVYVFDGNRRVYDRAPDGRSIGDSIYREHFYKVKIDGETPRKWKAGWHEAFKKNPYETGFYTAEMVEDAVWKKQHAPRIRQIIYTANASQLRAIAEILGYMP